MSYKIIVSGILISALCFFSFTGYFVTSDNLTLIQDQRRVEHMVDVKEINGEWRVVLSEDDTKSDVIARRGDRIIWMVEGSDVTFKFSNRGILGYRTRNVKDGNRMILPVLNDSPLGEFDYTVFIENSGTYARGQSPPRIIVTD